MSNEEQKSRRRQNVTPGEYLLQSGEIFSLESVSGVTDYLLETVPDLLFDDPTLTIYEIDDGTLRLLGSTQEGLAAQDTPTDLVQRAYQAHSPVYMTTAESEFEDESPIERIDSADESEFWDGCTTATPGFAPRTDGATGVMLVVNWNIGDGLEPRHITPIQDLADLLAPVIGNLRKSEKIERLELDLRKTEEMVEIYDRLLRHDLGNDLQVISGFSDHLLRMLEDDSELLDYIERINRNSESASTLIDNVGETVHTLQDESYPGPTEIEPILSDVVEKLDHQYESLSIEYDPEDFNFRAQTGEFLDVVFRNVLVNAVQHNSGTVSVSIDVETPSTDSVVIVFDDDGRGIPDQIRNDLFKMGKADQDSDGGGFGLGLARSLVESYGGSIAVDESKTGGAQFRITLEQVS